MKTKKKGLHRKWNTFSTNSGEDQKGFTNNGTLFSPNSSGHLRSDAHQSLIIGGDADEDLSQIIGVIQPNYWGEYIPANPPGFGTPASKTTVLW